MTDIIGSIVGPLLHFVRFFSHILIVLFHNALLVAIGLAILYVIFKFGRNGVARLRGLPSEQAKSAPEDEKTGPE